MRSMRLAAALAIITVLIGGCGNRTLTLSVDVASFLKASDSQTTIQPPVPPTPAPGMWISEDSYPALVDDQTIDLFSGNNDIVDVRAVSIRMTVQATSTSGAGSDTVRVYLSGPNTPPRPGTPVITVPITFLAPVSPATSRSDTVQVVLDQSQTVAQLFTGSKIRVSITNAVRGPVGVPGTDPPLAGSLQILKLDATVVAARKLP